MKTTFITYLNFCEKYFEMLPCVCPSCQAQLKVKSLKCKNCQTEVTSLYDLLVLARLSRDDLQFVKCSGSLKDTAKYLNLSYPTVRNMLDDIIEQLKKKKLIQNKARKKFWP